MVGPVYGESRMMHPNAREFMDLVCDPSRLKTGFQERAELYVLSLKASWLACLGAGASDVDDRTHLTILTILEGNTPDAFDALDRAKIAAFDAHFGVDVMKVAHFYGPSRDGTYDLMITFGELKDLFRNSEERVQPLSDFNDRAG